MRGKMRMLRGSARLSRRPDSTYSNGWIFGLLAADHCGLESIEVGLDDIDEEASYKILRGKAIGMLELDRV